MEVREVRLARYPVGPIQVEDFAIAAGTLGEPLPGQVVVRLRRLGLNAGLANRLGGAATAYGPGIALGDVPRSDAIVEVLESRSELFQAGDLAVRTSPWRSADVCGAEELRRISPAHGGLPLEIHLTLLGHVGFTAYTGLVQIGRVQPEDTVFVSGAAGGVGSCAVQFARARGATVIGSAGSAQKVRAITERLGANAAFSHQAADGLAALREGAPQGIDLFFDNVGGVQLEWAFEVLRYRGRIVICGAASQYGRAERHGPSNYTRMIYRELSMRGFAVTEHEDLRAEFEAEVGGWVRQGLARSAHTVIEGFGAIPAAFASMLAGANLGRTIVAMEDA